MIDNLLMLNRSRRLNKIEKGLKDISQERKKLLNKARILKAEYDALRIEIKRVRRGEKAS